MTKLIVCDLDGTLVTDNDEFTKYNKEVLLKCINDGHRLVINTGRHDARVINFYQDLNIYNDDNYMVCFQGGLVSNVTKTKILYENKLTKENVKEVLDYASELGVNSCAYARDAMHYNGICSCTEYVLSLDCAIKNTTEELYNLENVYKINLQIEPEDLDKLINNIPTYLKDKYYVIRTAPHFLEFMPKGSTKGTGLKCIQEFLGFKKEDTISIGDTTSDITMFKESGIGVAMDNSKDHVLEAADFVTLSNNESGVAVALDEIFYNKVFYNPKFIGVSSCLLGNNVKYNGGNNLNQELLNTLKDYKLIPLCPEVFGGLSIPRNPSEQKDDKVYMNNGTDVTENYNKGAEVSLKLIQKFHIKNVVLKERSPSCGVNNVYDGNFNHTLIKSQGVTTKLLKENNINIYSEEMIDELMKEMR